MSEYMKDFEVVLTEMRQAEVWDGTTQPLFGGGQIGTYSSSLSL